MNDLVALLLAVLANYRLARLVAQDEIARPLRAWLGQQASGKPPAHPAYWLAELAHCPYCLGVWFALPLALMIRGPNILLAWLAIAGGQALAQEWIDDRR